MTNYIKINTVVLGSGMAGLGAGIALEKKGVPHIILEKAPKLGGLCSSTTLSGCKFDIGPKILILDESENSKELLSYLGDNWVANPVAESVYISDYGFMAFPLQRNLIDLPKKLRLEMVDDIVNTKPRPVNSFKDWLANSYGQKFCELVLFPYEEKKWQMPLDQMDYKWALNRPVKVNLDEVMAGAKRRLLPNKVYYYPKKGSIATLTKSMAKESGNILFNQTVLRINLKTHRLWTKDDQGNVSLIEFKNLISSIPLDDLVKLSPLVPISLQNKSKKLLKRLSIMVINLVYRGDLLIDGTAIYFPEKKFIFRRVSILQNLCPALKKNGYTTVQVEISLNPNEEQTEVNLLLATISDLAKVDWNSVTANIEGHKDFFKKGPTTVSFEKIPFAYPLQVNGLTECVGKLHNYFKKHNVFNCGRGGNYDYCNSDLAYKQGKEVANSIEYGNQRNQSLLLPRTRQVNQKRSGNTTPIRRVASDFENTSNVSGD